MNQEIPPEVLVAFTSYEPGLPAHDAGTITFQPIGGGLINHSYRVSCQVKPDFFLQRFNKNVFTQPEQVQENYILIWEYAEFEFTGLRLPSPRHCDHRATLFVDEMGNYWRAFEFIEDSRMLPVAGKPTQAKATAKAFARFTNAFAEFNVSLLQPVIPGFHDLSLRYQQFDQALAGEAYERMAQCLPMIEALKKRERYKHFYELIAESDEFPQRVMHHDAKIANVLFSTTTGKVICPVDFDTVMPGYFFSDLGDLIRSMVSPEDENSTNFEGITVRKEFYEAILTGYLELSKQLTEAEKKYIHYAGPLIIYMQTLRFLTDYLNGDTYYLTGYAGQNFDRAKNQLILLEQLEDFLHKEYNFRHD
ncbi:MAG: aminoglycoside phosphotransferase family protein [Bacteroidota bacterium]|nr:aminoglycoside phosphotransferase family protein [Bacteroidota bacterium]